MYKTVRHGENSLQYTILPQTEEVLNNSGVKGKGRDYSPSMHVRRTRRRSTLKYIVLVIFGIIVALALASVPLYVMNGALYVRRNLQEYHEGDVIITTTPPLITLGRDIVKSRKKELKIFPEPVTTFNSKIDGSSTSTVSASTSGIVTSTASNERLTTPPWSMPALRSWKSSAPSSTLSPIIAIGAHNDIPLLGTPSTEGTTRFLDRFNSIKSWQKNDIITPTANPEPGTLRNVFKYYSYAVVPTINPGKVATTTTGTKFEDVLITVKPTTVKAQSTTVLSTSESSKFQDLKDTLLSVDDDDEFKESLEVDEVFSLPPLKPDFAAPDSETDDVTVSKAGDNAWYGARWPFVDTSSYFQWTGYSPGDNLLLPLLVAALSSVALVLLLALAVKRRKRIYTSSAQIGKLTADLQADDNTNLLTAENADDVEE